MPRYLHAEASVLLSLIKDLISHKIHKYESDMEDADHDEFICAEWAAGAMTQLSKDIDKLVVDALK